MTSPQTAKVTVQTLWNHSVVHYSLPTSLISDQGHNFESNLIKQLCELAMNGQYERLNLTPINKTGTLYERDKSHWRDFVPTLVHAMQLYKKQCNHIQFVLSQVWKKASNIHTLAVWSENGKDSC